MAGMATLSVLDLAPVPEGSDVSQALANTVDLARNAERLGYNRYWLAEHHNMAGIASAATSVVIGAVAAATKTIRVGAGGVMLPNHAPLVIAEQFGTLSALHPGRIDLGLGRAPGSDQATASRTETSKPGAVHHRQLAGARVSLATSDPIQSARAPPVTRPSTVQSTVTVSGDSSAAAGTDSASAASTAVNLEAGWTMVAILPALARSHQRTAGGRASTTGVRGALPYPGFRARHAAGPGTGRGPGCEPARCCPATGPVWGHHIPDRTGHQKR